jgi:hypothetical protein
VSGKASRGTRHTSARTATYCAARLQTLDQGASVSTYTVARELGHDSEAMVRRVYSHLGEIRHRSEVVEYRVEQHRKQIGDRLLRLGIVTEKVTASSAGLKRRSLAITEVTARPQVRINGPG